MGYRSDWLDWVHKNSGDLQVEWVEENKARKEAFDSWCLENYGEVDVVHVEVYIEDYFIGEFDEFTMQRFDAYREGLGDLATDVARGK